MTSKRAVLRNTRLRNGGRISAGWWNEKSIVSSGEPAALSVGNSASLGVNLSFIEAPVCFLCAAAHSSSSRPNSASTASGWKERGRFEFLICTVATPQLNLAQLGRVEGLIDGIGARAFANDGQHEFRHDRDI
jgi:hypothetical protein